MIAGPEGYAALMSAAGAVRLDRDVVRVGGPGAVGFLQGQLSQDVAGLAVGASAFSFLLQPQGKVDAWLRVTRSADDEVILDVDGGFGPAVVARLARFKLRVEADIDQLAWSCVAVRGPGAPTAPAPPTAGGDAGVVGAAGEAGVVRAVGFAWAGLVGWDLFGPAVTVPDGVPEVDPAVYEVCRIEAGVPRMGAELTDRTIPAEVGLVDLSASFTKGCYTGQELVARIDSRGGHVARRLRGLILDPGPLPAAGAPISVDGRDVGTLTSSAHHPDGHGVALGIVGRDVTPPAEGMCGGLRVAVTALPAVAAAR